MIKHERSWYSNIPILSNDQVRVVLTLLISIFFFIASLEGVKNGFKLIFSEWQTGILAMVTSDTAAITGLAVGMLCTALVQSSSAVVAGTMVSMAGMVSAGLPLTDAVRFGVPMVFGANIGTTITNTIVAFGVERGMTMDEFKDTIPGVIVDDVYEALTITIFFTLELTTGFLSKTVLWLGNFYSNVLQLEGFFASFENSIVDIIVKEPIIVPMKNILVSTVGPKTGGVLMFLIWFGVIILSMSMITKGLEKMIELEWEEKVKAAFDRPARGWLTGFMITLFVGSSSIGTSLVIPFLATKVVDLKKAYPYLVGCNMATAVDFSQIYGYMAGGMTGMVLGSAHILLNIIAMIVWFISPLRFVPVAIAEWLGEKITHNQNVAFALLIWVVGIFFVVPILIIYFL